MEPVPWSSSVLRGHAEEPQHRLHRPLLNGMYPQNHRLRPIGQSRLRDELFNMVEVDVVCKGVVLKLKELFYAMSKSATKS